MCKRTSFDVHKVVTSTSIIKSTKMKKIVKEEEG